MSDNSKDTDNQNTNQSSNQNTKDVTMTDLTPNEGVLKGKKTDIQNPELWDFPMNFEHHWS